MHISPKRLIDTIGVEQALLLNALMIYTGDETRPSRVSLPIESTESISFGLLDDILEDNILHYVAKAGVEYVQNQLQKPHSENAENALRKMEVGRNFNTHRNLLLKFQVLEILQSFQGAGLRPVLLKGAIRLFDELWPTIADRRLEDIDLLLSTDELARAVSILQDLGYEYYFPNSENYRLSDHHHLPVMIRKSNTREASIEIHHQLGGLSLQRILPASRIFAEAEELAIGDDLQVLVPSQEHQAIHSLYQASAYFVNGQRDYLPVTPIIESMLLLDRLELHRIDLAHCSPLVQSYIAFLCPLYPAAKSIQGLRDSGLHSFYRAAIFAWLRCSGTRSGGVGCYLLGKALRLHFVLSNKPLRSLWRKPDKGDRLRRYVFGDTSTGSQDDQSG